MVENFKEMGYLSDPWMGDISICAENCGGLNKNCIVVWFIIWIIETGFFPKVTLIFYVLVYAKNVSDRLFNILKGGVLNHVHTIQDMVQLLNYHEQVEVITINTPNLLT